MGKPFIPKKRVLSLRPEHRKAAEVSLQSREKIDEFVKKTRNPFGEGRVLEQDEVDELEKTLRRLERELLDRERVVTEIEARLVDKQRELWESEALFEARQKVLETQRQLLSEQLANSEGATLVNSEELGALKALRAEIANREQSLEESLKLMKEREEFVEEAEARLFEKTMEHQEVEAEQDMRSDELESRAAKLDAIEGIERPEVAKEVMD